MKVRGPGLDDGILHNFQGEQGEFIVDTQEAGPGEIKFRVGGPRGMLSWWNYFPSSEAIWILFP